MTAKALMIQGTGSGVGKSILTAAFCRWFYKRGKRVAPFKSQNMSLNSFVTVDGGEMGRAQAYQAEACGIEPHVRMNPILLKPSEDNRSQVVVMGKVVETCGARGYYGEQTRYLGEVLTALNALKNEYELLILEGAGSPAEINLREFDLVNMAMARAANAPVLLVGDIDRGGVFAWMKGTFDLLTLEEQKRVAGFIINKFRGDPGLLMPGIEMFEEMVERPVLGVVPFIHDFFADEEDALPERRPDNKTYGPETLDIAIIRLPRISNFTDFAPLMHDPSLNVRYVWHPSQLGQPDLLILPGTKNTLADFRFLEKQGLARELVRLNERGVPIFGICGGFQMLGLRMRDPHQMESGLREVQGLGLLQVETTLAREKTTRPVRTRTLECPLWPAGLLLKGYEIHMGKTESRAAYQRLFEEMTPANCPGYCNETGTLMGTYIHGLFDNDLLRQAFLDRLREKNGRPPAPHPFNYQSFRQQHLDRLADLVQQHIQHSRVLEILGEEA